MLHAQGEMGTQRSDSSKAVKPGLVFSMPGVVIYYVHACKYMCACGESVSLDI